MQDVLRYQGIEYDFIGIEEITNWEEDEFDMIISSLRSTKEGVTPNFFCTGNPGGRGHGWVKKRWITREPSKNNESYDISEYAFIGAKYTDNLILMKSDPNYVKRLNALPEKIRRAYRDGDWDIFEGQYFEEFRKDLHVIPHEYPRNAKKRWISLDYGYAAPASVHWHAQLSDGTVITYRELYVTKHTYRQLAVKILAMTGESEMEEIDGQVFADPSIFSKENESTATTAFEDMMEEGLVIQKAKNKRVPGWMHMRQGMQAYEDPNTGEITSRWKITEACPNLIRTLPAMIHDAKNVEDLDTKLEDHAPDSARYGLVEIKWEEIDEEFLVTANQAMLKKNVQNNPISINS